MKDNGDILPTDPQTITVKYKDKDKEDQVIKNVTYSAIKNGFLQISTKEKRIYINVDVIQEFTVE